MYDITLEFKQYVTLVRSPSAQAYGATWSTGYMGYNPQLRDIRDKMKDRVDIFINAYLSVNPKK